MILSVVRDDGNMSEPYLLISLMAAVSYNGKLSGFLQPVGAPMAVLISAKRTAIPTVLYSSVVFHTETPQALSLKKPQRDSSKFGG